MSFPHRTRYCFGLLVRPDGWQDRGRVLPELLEAGKARYYTAHSLCKTRLRIGIQEGRPFCYCPRCLVEVTH